MMNDQPKKTYRNLELRTEAHHIILQHSYQTVRESLDMIPRNICLPHSLHVALQRIGKSKT